MPILIGLCLGIALSLLSAPFIEEGCGSPSELVSWLKFLGIGIDCVRTFPTEIDGQNVSMVVVFNITPDLDARPAV